MSLLVPPLNSADAGCPAKSDAEWNRRFGRLTIPELFAEQVAKGPGAPALRDCRGFLTYRELEAEAEFLAARLQACGVSPGQLVVINTAQTRETITALLAVLRIGAAYTALDPASPPARLALMLGDIRPALILTQSVCARRLPDSAAKILNLDTELGGPRPTREAISTNQRSQCFANPAPDDLAYVSFTSGSTGSPKGVCIPHRAVVRLVMEPDYVTIAPSDIVLQFAPLSFDASTFEIWGALLNGASLSIFPPQKPSLKELGEYIESHDISLLWLTAGLFHQMADGYLHYFHKVRQLITGGDVLSAPEVGKVLQSLPNCRLINGYGPTENTTFSCCHPIKAMPPEGRSIPIGKAIARTYCRVLDEAGNLVKLGEPGELHVGGLGLALGYLADSSLTAQRFVHDRFGKDETVRLYRTGDRVRELENGDLEFLGRIDRQVKISGFRVELEEIEATIARHSAVREIAVFRRTAVSGYEQLSAFVARQTHAKVTAAELREFMQVTLPNYMIPRSIKFLAALPLNTNGKVDRDALRALDGNSAEDQTVPEGAESEAVLFCIWREVLGSDDFANDQNFFDIGGTSLSATHLLARIQSVFGKSIPMPVLLKNGTIAGLTQYLGQCPTVDLPPIYVFRRTGKRPALFCLPTHGGNLLCYANMESHFASDRPVYGIQSRRFLGGIEGQTITEMAAYCRQTILQQQPEGPYHLFGFCIGGLVAYEVACQLSAQGKAVGMLGVLDYEFHETVSRHAPLIRLANLFSFLRILSRGAVDLMRMPHLQRKGAIRRLRLRMGGLLRGKGWDEAYLHALQGSHARESERQALYDLYELACRNYVAGRFSGHVTLFRQQRLPISQSHDPTMGWSAVTEGRVRVQVIKRTLWHGAALEEPHAMKLTRAIESCIAEAEE